MLKVPLVYEFCELRQGKAGPIIPDQCIWHSKSAKGDHETSDHRLRGFRRKGINLYEVAEIVNNNQQSSA